MKCPCKSFKRKLALVSLAILASLLSIPHTYAMEDDSYSETETETEIEIKVEEGEQLVKLKPQIEEALVRTVGKRNDDFLKEYPFWDD